MFVQAHTTETNLIYIYTSQTKSSKREVSKKKKKLRKVYCTIREFKASKQASKQTKKKKEYKQNLYTLTSSKRKAKPQQHQAIFIHYGQSSATKTDA